MFLSIDPGQAKCGWALVESDGKVAERGIWPRAALLANVIDIVSRRGIDLIVLGDRTGHRRLMQELSACPDWRGTVCLVDEDHSSEEARRRYVRESTRGWRRLIPASLRYPDRPFDDYVAVILAERYLQSQRVRPSP